MGGYCSFAIQWKIGFSLLVHEIEAFTEHFVLIVEKKHETHLDSLALLNEIV